MPVIIAGMPVNRKNPLNEIIPSINDAIASPFPFDGMTAGGCGGGVIGVFLSVILLSF